MEGKRKRRKKKGKGGDFGRKNGIQIGAKKIGVFKKLKWGIWALLGMSICYFPSVCMQIKSSIHNTMGRRVFIE